MGPKQSKKMIGCEILLAREENPNMVQKASKMGHCWAKIHEDEPAEWRLFSGPFLVKLGSGAIQAEGGPQIIEKLDSEHTRAMSATRRDFHWTLRSAARAGV